MVTQVGNHIHSRRRYYRIFISPLAGLLPTMSVCRHHSAIVAFCRIPRSPFLHQRSDEETPATKPLSHLSIAIPPRIRRPPPPIKARPPPVIRGRRRPRPASSARLERHDLDAPRAPRVMVVRAGVRVSRMRSMAITMLVRRGLDVIRPRPAPLLPLRLVRVPPGLGPSHVRARPQDPQQQEDAGDGPDHDACYRAAAEDAAGRAAVICDDRRRRLLAACEDPREGLGEGPGWFEAG